MGLKTGTSRLSRGGSLGTLGANQTFKVNVAGAGTAATNGVYGITGKSSGRDYYTLLATGGLVYWNGVDWIISDSTTTISYYFSASDVSEPWLASGWTLSAGANPVPTVTAG